MTDTITPEKVRRMLWAATPGPWHTSEHDQLEVWANRDPAGWDAFLIATLRTRLNPDGNVLAPSDAALIAAGPDIAQAYLDAAAELNRLRDELEAAEDGEPS